MKIWKIKSEQTFDTSSGARIFNGTDIAAQYLDQKGSPREISFHFAYATNNYRGLVESVLTRLFENREQLSTITNVKNI